MENSMENVRYLISGDSALTVEFGNTISPGNQPEDPGV